MSVLVGTGKGDDYVLHQDTKLWANLYSSRGYREMRQLGQLGGSGSTFSLGSAFEAALLAGLPDEFRFEELLVWLYAFEGVPGQR